MTTTAPDTDNSSGRQPPQATPARARLAYDRTGRGEPLVLLHGQGFSRRSWDPIVEALAAHRDVIAVDLPGHGDSPRQPKGTGSAPYDLAVAVGELLDELGLPTVHVAGNSSGGWMALELGRLQRAVGYPDVAPPATSAGARAEIAELEALWKLPVRRAGTGPTSGTGPR